jgi:Flp pilus assembly protein TadD
VLFTLLLLLLAAPSFDDSFRAGLTALEHGDLAAAQSNLEEATRLAPPNNPAAAARAWVALAQAYSKQQKDVHADDAADKAAALAPDDPSVLQSLAVYYSESGRTLKGARFAAKYSARVPQNGDAFGRAIELYFEAARPLLDRQKFGDAVVILEEGVAALPKSAQLEMTLGVAYYGLRRFDDAANAFLDAIDAAPETEQPYNFLGKFLDRIPGRLPRVTQRFAEYESAHPASATGWLLHAKALDAQSIQPELSLRLLEKSIALNPSDASAHFEAGIVLDRLQRFSDAALEYQKAAAIEERRKNAQTEAK